MRRYLLAVLAMAVLVVSCQKETNKELEQAAQQVEVDMSDFYLYTDEVDPFASKDASKYCASMKVLNEKLRKNPGLEKRMYDIEKNSRKWIAAKKPEKPGNGNGGGGDTPSPPPEDDGLGVINIPVVVHVIYNVNKPQENISDAQIASQIRILNDDFNAQNNDVSGVPAEFADLVADSDFSFSLVQTIRKSSTKTSWGTNDAMKRSSSGGSDPVDPENKLNIWVCNIGGGILGYAQFPGGSPDTDGVVVGPQYFGDEGYVQAPFDKGRTTTHEVGHWVNLRHIWGDGRCRQDDFVADTPTSDGPNYGCPSYPTVNCRSNDMTMNYMDYTDDGCMYMFSEGQKSRMRSIFASGGPRNGFISL